MKQYDRPYIDSNGNVVIPFNIDQKYHSWDGGQALSVTLRELNVPKDIWHQYSEKPYPGDAALAGNLSGERRHSDGKAANDKASEKYFPSVAGA